MITIISGKGAPGATTTLAALAVCWPAPVLLADCDPAGGDLAPGWLGQWVVDGTIRIDRGVLSHATATRHATAGDPVTLIEHVQPGPPARHVALLAGLTAPGQEAAVSTAGWTRLTSALAAFRTAAGQPADALVDLGRYSSATPWSLLLAADVVLVAVRPTQRHVLAARPLLADLAKRIAPQRLGLAVCATTPAGTREVRAALGREVAVEVPADVRAAAVFSDGVDGGVVPSRSPLLRGVRRAARRLHGTYHRYTPAELRAPAPPTSAQMLMGGVR
ncbi:hypothetical protein [Amycolatopsis saalfeldensis]|uniref:MinD-like ATPase involved in chromosome partitioning or flagellar assembly n=1 Tax=Amycolatopsis saalfeldensis TaxID=394193 RepID=A0A1H8YNL9_9PSEU|nr:hypothetical protein [Amycolatopsis saalfeldensis]SEP53794.1 hypothetical protein SAMN04489732_13133 [Amycolatopsis saalfeldensis]